MGQRFARLPLSPFSGVESPDENQVQVQSHASGGRGYGLPLPYASTFFLKCVDNGEYLHCNSSSQNCQTGEIQPSSLITFHSVKGDQLNWSREEALVHVQENDVVTIYANIRTGGQYLSTESKNVSWGGYLQDVQSHCELFEFIVRTASSTMKPSTKLRKALSRFAPGSSYKLSETAQQPLNLLMGDIVTFELKSKPGYFLSAKGSIVALSSSMIGHFIISPPQLSEILLVNEAQMLLAITPQQKLLSSKLIVDKEEEPWLLLLQRLPLDIVYRVLQLQGRKKWLKTARLVCKSWCATAERHIQCIRVNGEFASVSTPEERRDLTQFMQRCENLTSITLRNVDELQDDDISPVLVTCRDIRIVKLGGCRALTNASCTLLPYTIEQLNVAGCNISDDGLEMIFKCCQNLTSLNIYGCKRVTDAGIAIVFKLEKLTSLNARGTNISRGCIETLLRQFPHKELLTGPILDDGIYLFN